jgi:hypothetical protein
VHYEVIAPLRVVEPDLASRPLQEMRLIGFIFQHQMHMTACQLAADRQSQLDQEMQL